MKRCLILLMCFVLFFSLCSCSTTHVNSGEKVSLTFIYNGENIRAVLPEDEAAEVIRILDDRPYDSDFAGMPSCGFDPNISLEVGDRSFAVACDTCNTIQDLGNLRYFSVTQEEIEYIHSLFEKYGGYFPCV